MQSNRIRMIPIIKVVFSHCRSNSYLIIGLCLGLSLSLLFMPVEIDECEESVEHLPYVSKERESSDEYEPKINIEGKPQHAQKTPKVFVRPRYYSTELGIRDKLFVGVLTSREYLHSRGVALNKTIAHLVDKIRFFISIPEGTKPNISLPGIVGFTDTRSLLKPFHVVKYITDNYLEDYDYYFLVKDTTYVNTRRLVQIANKISVSQDVHMGINSEIESYCSLDAGVLLSNSFVREMKTCLDWCVKNTFSDSDDINFGRCVVHSLPDPCSAATQGQRFLATKLSPMFDFERDLSQLTVEEEFRNSVSIYPIYDPAIIYKMSAHFTMIEMAKVQKDISKLRKEILETAHLGPENNRKVSWPVGNQPGNKAPGRFDVLRWVYFNETHSFLETDFENMRPLKGSAKLDIDHVLDAAVKKVEISNNRELKFKKLINGYRRFDASRGMDYILDLSFTDSITKTEINKRIEICKPLGKVEILPVPYVTENTRINLILVVTLPKKKDVLMFMAHYAEAYMEKKDKIFLMLVLLYDPTSPSSGNDDIYFEIKNYVSSLMDKYRKEQIKVTWLSIRLPTPVEPVEMNPMLKVAIADLSVRKFSLGSLILFVETGIELRNEYLNRVRMNTISQWQIFSPIPFFEFHPDIAYANGGKHVEIDINRNHGRYDQYNYNHIAFYARDYTAMRKTIEANIPLVYSDKDIQKVMKLSSQNKMTSIFEMFVAFTNLHPLRAVEPALKIRHTEIHCYDASGATFEMCKKQRSLNLGNRGQLARLVLEYLNSTKNK